MNLPNNQSDQHDETHLCDLSAWPVFLSHWNPGNSQNLVTESGALYAAAVASLERRVTLEHVLEVPPVRLTIIPGFDAAVFPYTTDIPFLAGWGDPLLFGPGSIHAAHTADESVAIAELTEAADHYVRIARHLLDAPR